MSLPENVRNAVDRIWRNDAQTMDAQIVKEELHRLTEIAESVDPLVIRLGEVAVKLERANGLLREAIGWNWLDHDSPTEAGVNTESPSCLDELYLHIQAHLQGEGDEA